jgi:DNA-directed RNA polymerase subunit RPC12/RpoP
MIHLLKTKDGWKGFTIMDVMMVLKGGKMHPDNTKIDGKCKACGKEQLVSCKLFDETRIICYYCGSHNTIKNKPNEYNWIKSVPNKHLCAIFDALDFITVRVEPQPTIERKIMMVIKWRIENDNADRAWFKTYRFDLIDRLKNWEFELAHPLTKRTVENPIYCPFCNTLIEYKPTRLSSCDNCGAKFEKGTIWSVPLFSSNSPDCPICDNHLYVNQFTRDRFCSVCNIHLKIRKRPI